MTIAIDFDGTIMRSSSFDQFEACMWLCIINAFVHNGHKVVISTMRSEDMDNSDLAMYTVYFEEKAGVRLEVVYCGQRGTKREACLQRGLTVDVWIDDMPETISMPVPIVGQGSYAEASE